MGNWWFGARWFGFRKDPHKRKGLLLNGTSIWISNHQRPGHHQLSSAKKDPLVTWTMKYWLVCFGSWLPGPQKTCLPGNRSHFIMKRDECARGCVSGSLGIMAYEIIPVIQYDPLYNPTKNGGFWSLLPSPSCFPHLFYHDPMIRWSRSIRHWLHSSKRAQVASPFFFVFFFGWRKVYTPVKHRSLCRGLHPYPHNLFAWRMNIWFGWQI